MNNNKQFSISFDEENYSGIFDSIEEAIDEAKNSSEVDVWIGEIVEPTFKVDAQNVLEWIEEDFYEQCGEHADGWLSRIKQSEINLLSDKLKSVVDDWMLETNNVPTFYSVNNAKKHIILNDLNK